MADTEKNKNNDMQVLRAIAIIMVVINHYKFRLPLPDWYTDSFNYITYWTGVDVFLALSGFLMFGMISRELERNGQTFISFTNFMTKRIFRLYPALIFWVGMSVLAAWYIKPINNADEIHAAINAISSLFAYSNIHWYNCVMDGMHCGSADLSSITWSLSLEWQLYIILFSLMFFMRGKRLVAALIILLFISAFIPSSDIRPESFAWWVRSQSFILGVLISIILTRTSINMTKLQRALMLSSSIFFICVLPTMIPYQTITFAVGVFGATSLLSCVQGDMFSDGLFRKVMIWIGDRSYSLYLSHLIVIQMYAQLIRSNEMLGFINDSIYFSFAISVLLMAVVAHLSFKYIESPLTHKGSRFYRNSLAIR